MRNLAAIVLLAACHPAAPEKPSSPGLPPSVAAVVGTQLVLGRATGYEVQYELDFRYDTDENRRLELGRTADGHAFLMLGRITNRDPYSVTAEAVVEVPEETDLGDLSTDCAGHGLVVAILSREASCDGPQPATHGRRVAGHRLEPLSQLPRCQLTCRDNRNGFTD